MQTAVNDQRGLVEGQKVDIGNDDVLSYLAEGGAIPFGLFVSLGTDPDNQAISPAAAGDLAAASLLGVTVRTHVQENGLLGADSGEYKEKDVMSVMSKGRIAVKMETAFTPTDSIEVRYAGAGVKGAGRVGNVVGETAPVTGVKIKNSGAIGDIAILDLNL